MSDPLRLIPEYPSAVSDVVLAYELGLIRKPYRWEQVVEGLAKLDRRLSWAALKEPRLMKRVELLQDSTVGWLDSHGRHDMGLEILRNAGEECFGYYSLSQTGK